jgi:hypothetical protein
MEDRQQPFMTIRSRRPGDGNSVSSADSTVRRSELRMPLPRNMYSQSSVQYGSAASDPGARAATHDTSRVSYHIKHIDHFAKTLEDSATRAFPNRGRISQRYAKVQALLLHWHSDDLFVIPELEDLEKCFKEEYSFDTDIFAIPSDNSHLELMMRIGKFIKDHEAQDTLFVVYYGGHARIDESRQSTWCATRRPDSPWLQWSAIQTLLERSLSDVLILLDCCAGAASATFPNGSSITETISASSWDAIAPDPGRYSFTNALIEVLQEWRLRTFSAAMLHAEVLARLKHPRPILINGKHFEARSTPVHFMMTSNHKAPSIEIARLVSPDALPPSPPRELSADVAAIEAVEGIGDGRGPAAYIENKEPCEDTPHVMLSLALEDNQELDINAWEQWLANIPALAKYVKVQGVFKSHSTLLLLSMPVMIWDLLPEDHATSFIAFIRSNNLIAEKPSRPTPSRVPVPAARYRAEAPIPDTESFFSDLTYTPSLTPSMTSQQASRVYSQPRQMPVMGMLPPPAMSAAHSTSPPATAPVLVGPSTSRFALGNLPLRRLASSTSLGTSKHAPLSPTLSSESNLSRTAISETQRRRGNLEGIRQPGASMRFGDGDPILPIYNQQRSARRTTFGDNAPEAPSFASHIESRLEDYYLSERYPNDADKDIMASNLGIEPMHLEVITLHSNLNYSDLLINMYYAGMALSPEISRCYE